MTGEEHNQMMRDMFSKITPEEREEMDRLRAKAEEMGMFYLVGECPRDNGPSTNGQKKD